MFVQNLNQLQYEQMWPNPGRCNGQGQRLKKPQNKQQL